MEERDLFFDDIEDDTVEENRREIVLKCVEIYYRQVTKTHRYIERNPCRTSALQGWKWIMELLTDSSKSDRCYQNLRMNKNNFLNLCELLHNEYKISHGKDVRLEEKVAIFLYIVGGNYSNRSAQERFQRSGETISKYFHEILDALVELSTHNIKQVNAEGVHPYVRCKSRYYPHFQHCIGAIDGTHIEVVIPAKRSFSFYGRKGYPTQNVMAACNFDLCFTYCIAGWEGSAHDTLIFLSTIRDPKANFKKPDEDQFYLVDSGYPNMKGFLAPYKNHRYHLQDYTNEVPRNAKELFNYCHSSLRTSIERTFGVWKNRFKILKKMSYGYDWDTQVKLVPATMAIHNFIRQQNLQDIFFEDMDAQNDNQIVGENSSMTNIGNILIEREMDEIRDRIKNQMWERRFSIL